MYAVAGMAGLSYGRTGRPGSHLQNGCPSPHLVGCCCANCPRQSPWQCAAPGKRGNNTAAQSYLLCDCAEQVAIKAARAKPIGQCVAVGVHCDEGIVQAHPVHALASGVGGVERKAQSVRHEARQVLQLVTVGRRKEGEEQQDGVAPQALILRGGGVPTTTHSFRSFDPSSAVMLPRVGPKAGHVLLLPYMNSRGSWLAFTMISRPCQ